MQVLCVASTDGRCDVTCPTCGQQYRVYYSRQSAMECEEARQAVRTVLLEHHLAAPTPDAHPSEVFNVPAWHGPAHMSGAALLSGAPLPRYSDKIATVAAQNEVSARLVS